VTKPAAGSTGTAGTTGGEAPGTGSAAAKAPEGCNSDFAQKLVGDTTLTEKCSPYTVANELQIDGFNLTIEPGVEVRFKEGATLSVAYTGPAKLFVKGSAEKPVRFVPDSRKEAGSWKGVHLYEKAEGSSLENLALEYGGDSASTTLEIEAADVTVRALKISNAKKAALSVHGPGPAKELSGLDLKGAGGDPDELVHLDIASAGAVSGTNTFPEKAVIAINGKLERDVKLAPQPAPWRLLGELYIDAPEGKSASLTIEAGNTVQLSESAAIYVGYVTPGGLKVKGTAEKPVAFVRYGEDAKSTPWKGITFYAHARAPELAYATFEYAGTSGGSALRYEDAMGLGSVDHCTFRHLVSAGISVSGAKERFTSFDNNTFDDVAGNAVELPISLAAGLGAANAFGANGFVLLKGETTQDTTLKAIGAPYHVEGELNVNGAESAKSATLTFEPGVTMLFNEQGKLSVGYNNPAKLVAKGTADKPVTFGAITEPWKGLEAYAHATFELENVVVQKTAEDANPIVIDAEAKGSAKNVTFKETKHGLKKCAPKFATSGLKADPGVKAEEDCG
jgi:hypothetical protein